MNIEISHVLVAIGTLCTVIAAMWKIITKSTERERESLIKQKEYEREKLEICEKDREATKQTVLELTARVNRLEGTAETFEKLHSITLDRMKNENTAISGASERDANGGDSGVIAGGSV